MSEQGQLPDVSGFFPRLQDQHLLDVLMRRFEIERISRYFTLDPNYSFTDAYLNINPSNSLFLRFPTLYKQFNELYDSPSYNLLLLLNLRTLSDFSDPLRLELQSLARKDNIDKTIVWSCNELSHTTIQSLKHVGIDTIYIRPKDILKLRSIAHFVPLQNQEYDYVVAVNVAADLLLKRLKKLFHLVLSEIAAPIYNKLYAKAKVATTELMRFEEGVVADVIKELEAEGPLMAAVDAGCGTGRHTFPLAQRFQRVSAFDLAPRMIKEAQRDKQRQEITNVLFSEGDFEYEEVMDESLFYDDRGGKIDLVVASFGFGSFIEDTLQMLRRFSRWLRHGGRLIISFYNKDSFLLQVTPNWRDTSLSAHLDVENNTLRVELSPEAVFHIYCKPYSREVLRDVKAVLDVDSIKMFPTVMSILPNSLLEHPLSLRLFRHVDRSLASSQEFSLGYYVTIVARKPRADSPGYDRILEILRSGECSYDILEHGPVQSIEDVRREIGDHPGAMVKTVVFQEKASKVLIAVAVMSEKRVDKKAMEELLGESGVRLRYAPERDVLTLGFPLGGLAPFGFSSDVNLRLFIDQELLTTSAEWLYMGVGHNRRTLKIRTNDFRRLVRDYRAVYIAAVSSSQQN